MLLLPILALMACLAAPAAADSAAGEGFAPLSATGWTAATDRGAVMFRTGIGASAVDAGLDAGNLELVCRPRDEGPRLQVIVRYWRGGEDYMLDLFNSSISGRPASWDAGAGQIPTAAIRFEMRALEAPPPDYFAAMAGFVAALDGAAELRVDFTDTGAGTAHALVFPVAGVGAALAQAGALCP